MLLLMSCSDTPNIPGPDGTQLRTESCPGIFYDLYPVSPSSWYNCGWATHNNTPPELWEALDDPIGTSDGYWVFKGASPPSGYCGFTLEFTDWFSGNPNTQVVLGQIKLRITAEATSEYGDDFDYEVWIDDGSNSPNLVLKSSGSLFVTPSEGIVEKDVYISDFGLLTIKKIDSLRIKIASSAVPRIHKVNMTAWGYVPGKACGDEPIPTWY